MTRLKEILSLGHSTTRRVLLIGGAFILGLILFAMGGIQVWEYINSSGFCVNACHGVHPEEALAYGDSYHARVECTECHLGRAGVLQRFVLNAKHIQYFSVAILDRYERPLDWEALLPASASCELCHSASAEQGDQLVEIRRFLPDETNTEKRTYLIINAGGGGPVECDCIEGYDIHWHALNPVEYIATDEEGQDIRWVRATLPDGRTVEYNDVTNPLSAEEIAEAQTRVMDCVDCHNRVGHPFPPPERSIDVAIAEGRLSRDLPFIKKEMLDLLTVTYPNQEAALATIESWEAQYKAAYPEVAATQAVDIQQATEVAEELLIRLVFEDAGITWESFIDEKGHRWFPGCFRCHDGQHLSLGGESIRLHCNICHSIPVTVDPGEGSPVVLAVALEEPASHLETNFMSDHRFQASDECAACHGEVAFGSDDSSFCANSACHSQEWPIEWIAEWATE